MRHQGVVQCTVAPHDKWPFHSYQRGAISQFGYECSLTDGGCYAKEFEQCAPGEGAVDGDPTVGLKFEERIMQEWAEYAIDAARIEAEL